MKREIIRHTNTFFPSGIVCGKYQNTDTIRIEFIEAHSTEDEEILNIIGAYAIPKNIAEELRNQLNEILGQEKK